MASSQQQQPNGIHDAATGLPLAATNGDAASTLEAVHLLHHLIHTVNIITSTLSAYLSTESLARNMNNLETSASTLLDQLPTTEQMYKTQMEEMFRIMDDTCRTMAQVYNTFLTLPVHNRLVAALASYRSLLDAVNVILPAVSRIRGSPRSGPSREVVDELRGTNDRLMELCAGNWERTIQGWNNSFQEMKSIIE